MWEEIPNSPGPRVKGLDDERVSCKTSAKTENQVGRGPSRGEARRRRGGEKKRPYQSSHQKKCLGQGRIRTEEKKRRWGRRLQSLLNRKISGRTMKTKSWRKRCTPTIKSRLHSACLIKKESEGTQGPDFRKFQRGKVCTV